VGGAARRPYPDQSTLFAAHDVDRIEFAVLNTLQYGLARHAKRAHRFPHWHEAIAGFTVEAGHEVIGQADALGVSCSPAIMPWTISARRCASFMPS
jgi:hypothetical protein